MMESKKDFKIMHSIIEDARIPITVLAKKTQLSREVVQYRLKNLEKELIVNYQARINLNYFSSAIYTIYISIKGVEREEAIKKLKKIPLVHWAVNCGGRWNYIVTFSVHEDSNLENFINELFSSFKNKISHYSLTQHIKELKDTFGGLFGVNEIRSSEKSLKRKIMLDEIDRKILHYLIENCRISNLEIAEKIKVTRETVRKRIINLEKEDILLGFRALIRTSALKLEDYTLAIKCTTSHTKDLEEVCNFISKLEGCSYVCITAGETNILITLSVKNLQELDKISSQMQNEFPNIIKEIEPVPLFEIGSQDYKI